MFTNLTDCKNCLKQDVCKIQEEYQYAVTSVGRANTTNRDCAIHYAIDNDAVNITAKCTKYAEIKSAIR